MAAPKRPTFAKLAHNPAPEPQAAPAAIATAEAEPMLPINAPTVQRSRQGKRAMTVYLPAELTRALRVFAAREDRTLEDMAGEAMKDLLRKYGEHPAG